MTNNWIEEENERATELASTGKTTNSNAPSLIKLKKKAPTRLIKSIYVQEKHAIALDQLVFKQKMLKGKKSPELIEEAIELLMHKYEMKF